MYTFESILDEIGGFGKFQLITELWIFSSFTLCSWSMMHMAFAGLVPDWYCVSSESEAIDEGLVLQLAKNASFHEENFQRCEAANGTACTDLRFLGPVMTVTEEWALVCNRNWIRSALISIQMGGILMGCFISGQLSDQFGRRRVLNGFTLSHAIVNIAAALTNSWQLFGVTRFLIGAALGGIITTAFPYGMEFLPLKWRPFTATVPFWGCGVAIFTGVAYFFPNWRHLHLALGILNIPCLIGYWQTPESIRWLAAKGKKQEAEAVLKKMADTNGRPLPPHAAELLDTSIKHQLIPKAEDDKIISYADLFKSWYLVKCTVVTCFFWWTMSLVVYGISFGVTSLAGNIYVNMLAMAVIEFPGLPLTFWLMNKFGRRKTALLYFALATISSLTSLCLILVGAADTKGGATRWLALLIRMLLSYAWSVIQTWGAELYPTVTRNISYGAVNTSARIGGILAPFIINLESGAVLTYCIITALTFLMTIAPFTLPETKGKVLRDHLTSNDETGEDHSVKRVPDMVKPIDAELSL
ncbi:hypothetical protein RRG08_001414 [Elysia crispata]|uniref:Major facilitator superfamily (MFS) profile domain-containing protein n=1 Tax=Elysia crispata TaxID=231223 RepID=A0AAE1DK48_9GAST|nr:hypothetical protein RRG08_001414 [Elysia crispata]